MNVDKIIAYECGELDNIETLKLFSEGIKNGLVWNLQGHYGRTARALIDNDIISENGEILWENIEEDDQYKTFELCLHGGVDAYKC